MDAGGLKRVGGHSDWQGLGEKNATTCTRAALTRKREVAYLIKLSEKRFDLANYFELEFVSVWKEIGGKAVSSGKDQKKKTRAGRTGAELV